MSESNKGSTPETNPETKPAPKAMVSLNRNVAGHFAGETFTPNAAIAFADQNELELDVFTPVPTRPKVAK